MKVKTKLLSVSGLAAVLGAIFLAGCQTEATPENLLKDMCRRTQKTESMIVDIMADIRLSADGDSRETHFDLWMIAVSDPREASIGGTAEQNLSGATSSRDIDIFTKKRWDTYLIYEETNGIWSNREIDTPGFPSDIEHLAAGLESDADRFKVREQLTEINGKECFELTGETDGTLWKGLFDTGLLDPFREAGLTEEEFGEMTFPCTVSIYNGSILPAQISLDMGDALESALGSTEVTEAQCSVEITFAEYDREERVVISPEALESDRIPQQPDIESGRAEWVAAPAEQQGILGDEWDDYTVQINERVLTLPCTVEDLEKADITFADSAQRYHSVQPGCCTAVWFVSEKYETEKIEVTMFNPSGQPASIENCLVAGIYADADYWAGTYINLTLPGDIVVGSKADPVKIYGEPAETYEEERSKEKYLWREADSPYNKCGISIDADSGCVDGVYVMHLEK